MPNSMVRRDRLLLALLLALACVAAYANGLTGTFTYDDKAIVRDNPRIRDPSRVGDLFTTPYFGGPRGTGNNFRPVLLLSYAAQWWIHGKDALAFHAVNLLLHIAATLLLFSVFLRAGFPGPAVGLGSLLFAIHPIHVEAVTSLVGRGETLAAVFVAGFLHLAFGFATEKRRRPLRLAGALLFCALGVFTKESAAVAPGLLFLLLASRGPSGLPGRIRSAFRSGLLVYAAAVPVLAGYVALRSWVLGGPVYSATTGIFEVENPLARLPWGSRALNACLVLLRYLGRIVFPLHLSADESAWSIPTARPTDLAVLAAAALIAVVLALAIARMASGSPAAFGVLFFAIAFLPTANVLVPIGTIFGERIAYLPSAGICLILGSVLAGQAATLSELAPWRRRVAVALALFLAVRTVTRNAVWWSDSAVFSNSVRVAPGSAKAHYNEGYVQAEGGRRVVALAHYTRAVEIYDGYWDAWAGRGRIEKELGRYYAAESSYRKALRVNPTYENGFFGLGLVFEERGRVDQAAAEYRRGLEKNPDSLPLAYRFALALSHENAPVAGDAWKRALALGPKAASVHADYADWLLRTGRDAEAVGEAREALRLEPGSVPALRVLARRGGGEGLGAALALEKAARLTRSREDLDGLARIAEKNAEYRPRFERVRPELEKRSLVRSP